MSASQIKRIIWITGSYFIDVDRQIVPYIRDKYQIDIRWIIMQVPGGAKVTPHADYEIMTLHYRAKDPRCYFEVDNYLAKIGMADYELIYSDCLGLMYYTALLHRAKNIPVIHAAHNVNPYPVWPLSLKIEVKYIFHRCRNFQMFSLHTARWFQSHYPHKSFFYAPMAVKDFGPVRTDHFVFDPSKINLLFFGNVVANKRLDLLIAAMNALPQEVADKVHLYICGKCNEQERYLQLIGDNRHITTAFRRIDDEEIPELFTKSSYLMLPYEDVAQSGPHMIAYNYNLPVIASDIEGFAERVVDGENGFLFKRNDKENLVDVIARCANLSIEEKTKMKAQLKDHVDRTCSIEVVAKKYVDYFKTI